MRHAAHANRFASKVKGWSVTVNPMRSMVAFHDVGRDAGFGDGGDVARDASTTANANKAALGRTA